MPLLCYAYCTCKGLDGRTVLGRVWGTAGLCRYDSDHVFSVGRLLCMPYSGCAAAYLFDTQVSPVIMSYSNPFSIGPVLAQ